MEKIEEIGKNTFSSLQIKNYRLYFIGQAISLAGTWMQIVAQGLLVLQLSGSGTILGTVLALQFLPILLFGPMAGVLIDHFPKRTILYVTQSLSGILALLLGTLVAFNLIQIWMVYFFAICLGFILAIDNPTRQVFISEMVGKNLIKNAISLSLSEVNVARIIGPALAGIFIASIGIAACFLFNGLSFIAVLVVLYLMDPRELQSNHNTAPIKGQLREGFAYVKATPILRDTLLMIAIIGTLSYEFTVSLPLMAQFTFANPVTGYASLMSAMGLGAIIGGLFSANKHNTTPRKLIQTTLLFGITILIASITPSLMTAIAAMLLVGFFSINFMSIANTILQTHSAVEMKGRVMSLWTVAFLGSTPIGAPIIGWIGEHAGPRWALGIGGLAAIIAAGIGMMLFEKRERHIPTPSLRKATLANKSYD